MVEPASHPTAPTKAVAGGRVDRFPLIVGAPTMPGPVRNIGSPPASPADALERLGGEAKEERT